MHLINDCFELPIWHSYSSTNSSASKSDKKGGGPREEEHIFLDDLARLQRQEKEAEALRKNLEQETESMVTQTGAAKSSEADFTNLETVVNLSPIPTSRIIPSHPSALILGDPTSAEKQEAKFQKALQDESWLIAMQEELLQFEIQKVWILGTMRLVALRTQARGRNRLDEMDVKSAFLYGKIDEEVYVSQPLGFLDPKYPEKVYKVVKALYGLHQAPRACTEPSELVSEPVVNESNVEVQPKVWSDAPIIAEYDSDSDYAGANLDRKSTTGGCQFLGRRLITWQCKKQTIVATSTTEAEYVAAASCCGQVLWIQNQMLDYGFNFMNTKIYIDNESTICIVKNPVYHSKTKHIAIRHHFIRDAYEKKLIQFKSKKIAQVVRAWIQSKNSLVKHFEDMRLCRPFKESLHVWFNPPRDVSMSCLTTKGMHTIGVVCTSPNLFLLTDLSLLKTTMAAFESVLSTSCRILEMTEVNVEFHESLIFFREVIFIMALCRKLANITVPLDHFPVSDQAKEIKLLKATITKLKKHHKEYLKIISLQQRFPRKSFSKKYRMHKESVSKQGRKKAKGESSVQRDPLFDVMPEDKIDHMETENAQSEGRTREMVDEEKEFDEDSLSTEDEVSTDKEGVSTDFEKVSTDRPIVSTDESKVSTDEQVEGTEGHNESTEEESTMALELIRFIKKVLADLESKIRLME
ncbi:putative ribonuclease H-like domain-containing protein [Tanacetum coccineum]